MEIKKIDLNNWSNKYEKYPNEVYGIGDSKLLTNRLIAVVGSRETSKRGREMAKVVVKGLVDMGVVVVSGLAVGIDTCAHNAALENNGKTIAVLAHGLDMIYPKENKGLANGIVDKGGLLVSEYSIGVGVQKWQFLARNRLMVGLCDAVVIIEAQKNSGSTATAGFAGELGKELFVVPGSPGCDDLILDGANHIDQLWEYLA